MQSDINQRPFTNGTHYINTNINFYLRRQDPFAEYGLQYTVDDNLVGEDGSTLYNYLIDLTPYGDYKDITSFDFFSLEDFKGCQI